jgi:hypothetical protein
VSAYEFDKRHKASNIKIKKDGRAYKSQDNHGAVRGSNPLPATYGLCPVSPPPADLRGSGVQYFEVVVRKTGMAKGSSLGHCYYIGVRSSRACRRCRLLSRPDAR